MILFSKPIVLLDPILIYVFLARLNQYKVQSDQSEIWIDTCLQFITGCFDNKKYTNCRGISARTLFTLSNLLRSYFLYRLNCIIPSHPLLITVSQNPGQFTPKFPALINRKLQTLMLKIRRPHQRFRIGYTSVSQIPYVCISSVSR
jgi:hypothetical protein